MLFNILFFGIIFLNSFHDFRISSDSDNGNDGEGNPQLPDARTTGEGETDTGNDYKDSSQTQKEHDLLQLTSILKPAEFRQMTLIGYFEPQKKFEIPSDIANDFAKVKLTIQNKEIIYPFLTDKKVGRVDIKLDDHLDETKIFIADLQIRIKIENPVENSGVDHTETFGIYAEPNKLTPVATIQKGIFQYLFYAYLQCDSTYEGINCASKSTASGGSGTSNPISCDGSTEFDCYKSVSCPKTDTTCLNEGECFQSIYHSNKKYCVCKPPFGGRRCESKNAEFTDFDLIFGDKYGLPQVIKSSGCSICPNQQCDIYGNFKVCTEDHPTFYNCDQSCNMVCSERFCKNVRDNDIIYYLAAFRKDHTSITETANNIVNENNQPNTQENTNVSPQGESNQKSADQVNPEIKDHSEYDTGDNEEQNQEYSVQNQDTPTHLSE